MFLYNLTLQRATGISYAIHGNFSGKRHSDRSLYAGVSTCLFVYGSKGEKAKNRCGIMIQTLTTSPKKDAISYQLELKPGLN